MDPRACGWWLVDGGLWMVACGWWLVDGGLWMVLSYTDLIFDLQSRLHMT